MVVRCVLKIWVLECFAPLRVSVSIHNIIGVVSTGHAVKCYLFMYVIERYVAAVVTDQQDSYPGFDQVPNFFTVIHEHL